MYLIKKVYLKINICHFISLRFWRHPLRRAPAEKGRLRFRNTVFQRFQNASVPNDEKQFTQCCCRCSRFGLFSCQPCGVRLERLQANILEFYNHQPAHSLDLTFSSPLYPTSSNSSSWWMSIVKRSIVSQFFECSPGYFLQFR